MALLGVLAASLLPGGAVFADQPGPGAQRAALTLGVGSTTGVATASTLGPALRSAGASAAASGSSAAAVVPAPAPAGPTLTILLDGLCTDLPAGRPWTAAFDGPDGIAARLVASGFPVDGLAGFSYRGGAVDAGGTWQPVPYACADSRDNSLANAVDLLDSQIGAMAAAHPGARIRLIGFSQGGLVAFAWLARLTVRGDWLVPNGAAIDGVVTLDAPLGGLPFVETVCALAPDMCGGRASPADSSTLRDMGKVWDSAAGHPAAATRSIAAIVTMARTTNEAVAVAAASHGVRILTVGNVRDWFYAPAGPNAGKLTFLDTQWLTTQRDGLGVYARAIDSGPSECPLAAGDLAASYGCNHALVLRDVHVFNAIVRTLAGSVPELADTCPPGRGGCLTLPPRPSTILSSVVAPGLVTGGGRFGTSAAKVRSGGRATILFKTSPVAAGKPVQIWGRSRTGSFRFMTTRVADRHGVVRYFTPPITGWAAIQARYEGDFVNGPGVSPARVVTVR